MKAGIQGIQLAVLIDVLAAARKAAGAWVRCKKLIDPAGLADEETQWDALEAFSKEGGLTVLKGVKEAAGLAASAASPVQQRSLESYPAA